MRLAERRLYPTCACGRPAPIGKRKCYRCLKPGHGRTIVVLRGGAKGRNATGIAGHKPDKPHTRKAKRQNLPQAPQPLKAYNWRHV